MLGPTDSPDRLDSWKAIAEYLKRDIATTRRWEKELGLPVRRIPGGRGRSVFAYRSEIDAWLAAPGLDTGSAAPSARPRVFTPTVAMTDWRLWVPLTVVVLAAGSLGLMRSVNQHVPAPPSDLAAERLWSGPDVDSSGGISRDGRLLTYVDWEHTGNLMIRHLDTGTSQALTNKKSWAESPEFSLGSAVSPDNQRIGYGWITVDGPELRIIQADGSRAATVCARPDLEGIWPFDWSPDGRKIAALLVSDASRSSLALIDVIAGDSVVLTQFDWRSPDRAFFSPDGRYLAYDVPAAGDPRDRVLTVLSVNGTQELRVAVHPSEDRVIGWTPEGSLLFSSDRTGGYGLWAVPFKDGTAGVAQLVRADVGRAMPVGMSSTGDVFYTVASKFRELRFARLDPSTATQSEAPRSSGLWLPNGIHEWRTSWAPDGKAIALFPTRGGSRGSAVAVISNVTTGESRQVPVMMESANAMTWAHDGQGWYVAGRRLGERALFYLPLTGGPTRALLAGESIGYVTVTRDGAHLYATRYGRNPGILDVDVQTGAARQIYRGEVWNIAVSPDGTRLAAITRQSGLSVSVISLAGGVSRTVFEARDEPLGTLAWSHNGERIFFNRKARRQLWSVSLRDGTAQATGIESDALNDVSISPDGARVAITGGTVAAELWRLRGIRAPRWSS